MVLPKFYVLEKTRDLVYSGSRVVEKKLLLAKQACSVKNGRMNWKHFELLWALGQHRQWKAAGTRLYLHVRNSKVYTMPPRGLCITECIS